MLISPCGTTTELVVKGFVPYLPEEGLKVSEGSKAKSKAKGGTTVSKAAPATEGGSSSSKGPSIIAEGSAGAPPAPDSAPSPAFPAPAFPAYPPLSRILLGAVPSF